MYIYIYIYVFVCDGAVLAEVFWGRNGMMGAMVGSMHGQADG